MTDHCIACRLDFVAKYAHENSPGVASKLLTELEHVGRGAKVAYSNIAVELASLQKSMRATQTKLNAVSKVADKMHKDLSPRVADYSEQIGKIAESVTQMDAERIEVMTRFGEDPKSGDIGELFKSVVDFLGSWEAAVASLDVKVVSGTKDVQAGPPSKSGGSAAADGAAAGGAPAKSGDNKIEDKLAAITSGNFRRRVRKALKTDPADPATESSSARQKDLERERLRRR